MDRRAFLTKAGLFGCSAAASPFVTPITMANAAGRGLNDNRLVVIILRGAMDGLDAVRPIGDPNFADLRQLDNDDARFELDGFFGLHPALGALMPWWASGELAFAHAVATPYRDKRSHFDGQDMLEAGIADQTKLGEAKDGWLNRMLQLVPGVEAQTAYAVGRSDMRILWGDAPTSSWAPETMLQLTPHAQRLLELIYHDDPMFREAAMSAEAVLDALGREAIMGGEDDVDLAQTMAENGMDRATKGKLKGVLKITEFAVSRLRRDTRIVSYSMNGWDTHAKQGVAMPNRLEELAASLVGLKAGLGPIWDKTAVLVMTEFGRTVRENGTKGTDHGTGGAMIMAGGAVRGGQVVADWPGLAEADLYNRRDLMPTVDVRALAAHTLRGLYGFGASDLERTLFPGLDLGRDPGIIL